MVLTIPKFVVDADASAVAIATAGLADAGIRVATIQAADLPQTAEVRAQGTTASVRHANLLSSEQIRMLQLAAAEGLTAREIATRMHLTVDVVKFGMHKAYRALNANGRAHAVAIALRAGILGGA